MTSLTILLLALVAITVVSYHAWSLRKSAIVMGAVTLLSLVFGGGFLLSGILILVTAGLALLSVKSLRIQYLSRPIFSWFKSVLPPLSQTEQEAIDAGTVWWDGELFSGRPKWNKLLDLPKPEFSQEEQAFIDGPVQTLIGMVDNWDINHNTADAPEEAVAYIKEHGFLGMIIPKAYGGLEFSGMAQTEVMSQLAASGACVSLYVGVPNSLGPGELLIKYGTEQQKDHYLPRLADGREIPCFALTGPHAGSDATALPDTGVVCNKKIKGKNTLGINLNFNKRYITLAPVATLIGLAFRLEDPDHLIGEVDDYGITCALIPHNTKGVTIGRRHKPIGDSFLNGPIQGKDVFVPLDAIIGGQEMAGKGWRMLVDCLSVGRCITLPSISNSMAKHLLLGTTAYAALRQQFGVPISKFEGVQKPLARMTGMAYIINAARLHTAQSLSYGEKPSVASAILKYHLTEMARQVTLDAMDIHGGKAVMTGPKNYVADAYSTIPVAITVEGANIMTRNLMIFGQGAVRSHPYVLKEMELAGQDVNDSTTAEFDDVFFAHAGFALSNKARAFAMALGVTKFSASPGNAKLARHYHDINRLSAAFALVADISMLSLQSKLKFKEMLSARLGDLLSNLYLASMVLKHYEAEGCREQDYPVIQWSVEFLLHRYQVAMLEILQNYPIRLFGHGLKVAVFPLGAHFSAPSDELDKQVAKLVTANTQTRSRLVSGTFDQDIPNNPLGMVNAVFLKSFDLAPLYKKIREAIKRGEYEREAGALQIKIAQQASTISELEAKQLLDFEAQLLDVINVDDFDPAELIRQSSAGKQSNAKKRKVG